MDEHRLNVRWNDHTAVLLESITRKLQQEQLVDVVLACEGRSLKCHRLILSACSPYFDQVLSELATPNLVIFLKDTKFWELKALVNFMYYGEVVVSQEKLPELCEAAEKLKVRGLAKNIDEMSPAAEGGGGQGGERVEEERSDISEGRYGMVDLLHYGAEATQRSMSGGGHQQQQPLKSLLRPLSNLPAPRKLQGIRHKGQLEPPRLSKISKFDRPSVGGASPNGANMITVNTSAPKAYQPRPGWKIESNGGNAAGSSFEAATESVSANGGQEAVKPENHHFGANADLKIQRQEMKNENGEDSKQHANVSELQKSFKHARTSTATAQSSPSPSIGPPMGYSARVQVLEKAALLAVSTKNVRQAAMEFEIPRTTLNAYMKRKGISVNQTGSHKDNGNGGNVDYNSSSVSLDCKGKGSSDQTEENVSLSTYDDNSSGNESLNPSEFVGVSIDID